MSEAGDRLAIGGREKLAPSEFKDVDTLYVGFDSEDVDAYDNLKIERIRFPDFSCNWSRFSIPSDVRLRPNSQPTDGCYSFTVNVARYKQLATPVHDPIAATEQQNYENYAHVEVRELLPGEPPDSEPPRGRKPGSRDRKKLRLEYRQNILNNRLTELAIGQNA